MDRSTSVDPPDRSDQMHARAGLAVSFAHAKRITRVCGQVEAIAWVRGWRVYPLWCTRVAITEWSDDEHRHSSYIPWLARSLLSPSCALLSSVFLLLVRLRFSRLSNRLLVAPLCRSLHVTPFVGEILLPEV